VTTPLGSRGGAVAQMKLALIVARDRWLTTVEEATQSDQLLVLEL
jgi:hypothetical protein